MILTRNVIDERLFGNIAAAGICAHESAMRNNEPIIVPKFKNSFGGFKLPLQVKLLEI